MTRIRPEDGNYADGALEPQGHKPSSDDDDTGLSESDRNPSSDDDGCSSEDEQEHSSTSKRS